MINIFENFFSNEYFTKYMAIFGFTNYLSFFNKKQKINNINNINNINLHHEGAAVMIQKPYRKHVRRVRDNAAVMIQKTYRKHVAKIIVKREFNRNLNQ